MATSGEKCRLFYVPTYNGDEDAIIEFVRQVEEKFQADNPKFVAFYNVPRGKDGDRFMNHFILLTSDPVSSDSFPDNDDYKPRAHLIDESPILKLSRPMRQRKTPVSDNLLLDKLRESCGRWGIDQGHIEIDMDNDNCFKLNSCEECTILRVMQFSLRVKGITFLIRQYQNE